jgi:hypothetical protein
MTADLAERAMGHLAERMVPVAAELAFAVRERDVNGIAEFLAPYGPQEIYGLLIVTAAMVDIDRTTDDLLSWVSWDERFEPPCRDAAPKRARNDGRVPAECGTYAAARRHQQRGEALDQPCKDAANEYMRDWRAGKRGNAA